MSELCGVKLEHNFPDDAVFLRGIAIVQALDSKGNLRLWVSSTGGVTKTDALSILDDVKNRLLEAYDC